MSRVYTFLGVAMVIIVSIYAQNLAMEMLAPGTPMWNNIAGITWPVDGDVWAKQMYTAVTVWFIWIIRIGAVAGGIYREFLQQNVTATRARGVRPR